MIDHETEIRTKLANQRENADIVRRYHDSVMAAAEKWASSDHVGPMYEAIHEQLILDGVVKI